MQSTHETFTGVILRDTVYKDADKILTILARGKGIITAKARGAMKTGSRQIRRMCEALGYRVLTLNRIRIMNIHLGRLKPGHWRNLTPAELETLMQQLEG